jgi:hypothetical protein
MKRRKYGTQTFCQPLNSSYLTLSIYLPSYLFPYPLLIHAVSTLSQYDESGFAPEGNGAVSNFFFIAARIREGEVGESAQGRVSLFNGIPHYLVLDD